MASIKAQARAAERKLTHKIDGNTVALQIAEEDVYVTDLVNDDFDAIDKINDEYSELARQADDLSKTIADEDDQDERKKLREQARELKADMRVLDTQMLAVYVEKADGTPFTDDVLQNVPVRVQTALMLAASKKVHDGDEDPTTAGTAST